MPERRLDTCSVLRRLSISRHRQARPSVREHRHTCPVPRIRPGRQL